MSKIIECIPNFCEGQDPKIISEIGNAIESVSGVNMKCIDTGYYAHRSVYTFLGELEPMMIAAYASIKTATQLIDMRCHLGAHPRFGAVDVFPFVALENIASEDLIPIVNEFAEKCAQDFKIPTYLYEKSALRHHTRNLASIRKGEYEGLELKMKTQNWEPDFYPEFNAKSGGMTMGVRDLLIAFNVNLDTKDVNIAKRIAEDIRWSGKIIDKNRVNGLCKGVKALGWYIRDFDRIQVSMNLVDITETPIHIAYETCKTLAEKYNVNVTGSELIGCIPRQSLIDAGKYYSENKLTDDEYIEIAIEELNLNEVKPFDLDKNVIDF